MMFYSRNDFIDRAEGDTVVAYMPSGELLDRSEYFYRLEEYEKKYNINFINKELMYVEYRFAPEINDGLYVEFKCRGIVPISIDSDLLIIPESKDAILPKWLFKELFYEYFEYIEISPVKMDYLYELHLLRTLGSKKGIDENIEYIRRINEVTFDYPEMLFDVKDKFGLHRINLSPKLNKSDEYLLMMARDWLVDKYKIDSPLADNVVSMACGNYKKERLSEFRTAQYGYVSGGILINLEATNSYLEYINDVYGVDLADRRSGGTKAASRL